MLRAFICILLFSCISKAYSAEQVAVQGLFKGMAILVIDGNQHTLRAGETSPEGVKLISADAKAAVIEINGQQKKLGLNTLIGAQYREAEKTEVRLSQGRNGHFYSVGRINGHAVNFMVDTGASFIAMNSLLADELGLRYKALGQPLSISTASGLTKGYSITLNRVSIGSIEVRKVEAVVIEGAYPVELLLGNSYLDKVDYSVENGVMLLRSKF